MQNSEPETSSPPIWKRRGSVPSLLSDKLRLHIFIATIQIKVRLPIVLHEICPEMILFSQCNWTTPKIGGTTWDDDSDGYWDGKLNQGSASPFLVFCTTKVEGALTNAELNVYHYRYAWDAVKYENYLLMRIIFHSRKLLLMLLGEFVFFFKYEARL